MKNIDKIIHWKLLEITFLISLVIISFPVWKQLNINEELASAAFYNEVQFTHLEIPEYPKGPMYPINNKEALQKLKRTEIKIINDTKTQEDYTLLMSVAKDSTLDYHCLNVAINDNVKPLKEYYLVDDEKNLYFALTSGDIKGETKNYHFLMWMDESTGNEMQGKTLSYSFELQKNIEI